MNHVSMNPLIKMALFQFIKNVQSLAIEIIKYLHDLPSIMLGEVKAHSQV